MSELKFDGAHGAVLVQRHTYFECCLESPDGRRHQVTWPPTPASTGAPFYVLLCELANRSAGVVLIKGTTRLGWKRKADAVLAAQEMQRVLGSPRPEAEEPTTNEERDEGVRVWFSWSQLGLLRRLFEEGAAVTHGLSAHDNQLLSVVEDKLDSAHRSLMAKRKEK